MNNEEAIDTLKKLHASGMLGFPQITALDKAISALSAKPESTRDDFDRAEPVGPAPCAKCGYNGPGYYQPGTHSCVARSAKANVVTLVCVGCGIPTDNVVPQCRSCCTNWFDARDKAISALSKEPAKPPDIVDWLKIVAALSKEPAQLPEVEEWIENEHFHAYSSSMDAIPVESVRAYLQQLTAAHAAKLAAIEHERSGVEGAMYARILALEAELAEKEKTK